MPLGNVNCFDFCAEREIDEILLVYEGAAVWIKCHSTATPSWTRNGVALLNPETNGKILIIRHVKEKGNGIYSCNNDNIEAKVFVGGIDCLK